MYRLIDLTPGQRSRSLGAIMIHMMGIGLTLGLTFPLTSLTLEVWGRPEWEIGLASAMSPLAILIFMPVLPRIAKRLGAVRAMTLGCLVGAAGLMFMYGLPIVWVWIAARFVIGAGLALPWLVGDVWVNSVAREQSRGKVIAGYVTCFFIGFSLGPLALDAVGISGIAPFLIGVGALGLAMFPLILVRRHAPTIEAEAGSNLLATVRLVPVMAVGAFLAGFTEALIFSLLTIWGLAVGLDDTAALRLLTTCVVGGVLLQFVFGLVADKFGRQRLLGLIGLALTMAAIGLQFSAGMGVYAAAFVIGGLTLALYGLSLTLLGERFPPTQLAVASAVFLILYQMGSMTGPLVAGVSMDRVGPPGFVTPLVVAGLLIAGVAFSVSKTASKTDIP